jgi:hypothetical protein
MSVLVLCALFTGVTTLGFVGVSSCVDAGAWADSWATGSIKFSFQYGKRGVMDEPTDYEKKIIQVFKEACEQNKGGVSPADVTKIMSERGELAMLDTVIDVAGIMRDLRKRGLL